MLKNIKKIIAVMIIILAALLVSKYLYQLMLIQGDSMSPSYKNFTFAVVDKHSRDFKCNDVIAFKTENVKGTLVKRIVGVPGDSLIVRDKTLYVNGKEWNQNNISNIDYAGCLEKEIVLGESEYFVLGDNVSKSKDSRYEEIGIINKKDVIGKIIFPVK